MQPMAERLGVDHQQLQQLVASSTSDCRLVRANVALWAAEAIDPAAYVIDDSGLPKDGTASPGSTRALWARPGTAKIDAWGLPNLPVAADSGYGDCTLFRLGLTERGRHFAVQVDPDAIRPSRRRGPGHRALHRTRDARSSRHTRIHRSRSNPGPGRRPRQCTARDLAPRQPTHQGQPDRGDALAPACACARASAPPAAMVAEARERGLELTGPNGLLKRTTRSTVLYPTPAAGLGQPPAWRVSARRRPGCGSVPTTLR
jgi:hypothetical protein